MLSCPALNTGIVCVVNPYKNTDILNFEDIKKGQTRAESQPIKISNSNDTRSYLVILLFRYISVAQTTDLPVRIELINPTFLLEGMEAVTTCQLCDARSHRDNGRCPLCGDIIDREALKRSCIHCGRFLLGAEFVEAVDMGGWFSGELVCRDCRKMPTGPAILTLQSVV
jgi:hypothetical protein